MNAGDFITLLKVVSDGLHSMDTDYKDVCLRIVQGHLAAALKEEQDKVESPVKPPVEPYFEIYQLERRCPNCEMFSAWDVDAFPTCNQCRLNSRPHKAGWDVFMGNVDSLPAEAVALTPTNLSIIKKGDYLVCDGWDRWSKRNFWRFRKIEKFHQAATMDVITDSSGRRWLNPPTNRRLQYVCFSGDDGVEGRVRFRHIITAEDAEKYRGDE